MRVLLLPFTYIYRFFKYLFLGLYVILKQIFKFIKHFFLGFKFLPLIFASLISNIYLQIGTIIKTIKPNKKDKETIKSTKQERKELLKKESKDVYINKNVKFDKKTADKKIEKFGSSIIHLPRNIFLAVTNFWNNLPLVKEAKNRKDINREVLLIDFNGEDAKRSKIKLTYQYQAKTPEGKFITGYFDAHSKVEVHSFLLSEGYTVYSIKTSKLIQLLHGSHKTNHAKIKIKDLIFLLAQLSTYLKAGIPLVDSMKILVRQFKKPAYEKILKGVVYDLSTGQSFSEALSKQGDAFPRLLINMVKTSEMTGELPEALDDMEEYYTQSEATRKAMVSAMMYPIIIFIIAIGVGTFIMLYVVPKFVEIYESMDNAQIPKITLFVLGLSDFLSKYIIWLGLAAVILILLFAYLYRNIKAFRTTIQWILMHLPVFGNVVIYNEVTMFTKTFSSLLAHNVFITDSMDILNKVTNNEIYKMMILDAITNVAKGDNISTAFKDHWAFPLPAYEMIVTGEKTGQLPEMMDKVSKYYQDLHKNAVARIKSFVEPALIIMLTVMVGVIVLSIVVPMFNMYSAIQQ